MILSHALIDSKENGQENIFICSLHSEEDTDSCPLILHYESKLAQDIMRSAVTKQFPTSFLSGNDPCEQTKYTLLFYRYRVEEIPFNIYRQIVPVGIKYLPKKTQILIYREKCSCGLCYSKYGYDNLELYTAVIHPKEHPDIDVRMNVYRCTRCERYFALKEELDRAIKQFGQLDINATPAEYTSKDYNTNDSGVTWRSTSILSENGYHYNVKTEKRRHILIALTDENKTNYYEIVRLLKQFIKFNGYNSPDAIPIWESDLKFIEEYACRTNKQELHLI